MKYWCLSILLLTCVTSYGQNPNFSEHVAPIFYENCVMCHRTGGIAPFSLVDYTDAYLYAGLAGAVVANGTMPPWPPDTTFQRYVHERILTSAERQTIIDWVTAGAPEGDTALAPDPPGAFTGTFLGTPDLKVTMPAYTSKAQQKDDYVCIVIPTGLTTDRTISAVEVVPGNREIVHHCLVYIDSTATFNTDTTGTCGGPSDGTLVAGFVPGSMPTVFPNGSSTKMGISLPAGSNLILAMHYPEGSNGLVDSTSVNLHFYPQGTSGVREITANPIINDWGFCIDANTVDTVNVTFPPASPLGADFTVLSVFPHMHLLGQQIETHVLDIANDTIPLCKIPKWDFEWQGFYNFKKPVKIPAGSRVYASGIYDNTAANVHNPNNPPQQVCAGLNTSDEMFLVYFQYLPYVTGDENLNMDSLLTVSTYDLIYSNYSKPQVMAYPNPFSNAVTLSYSVLKSSAVELVIFDPTGKRVFTQKLNQPAGVHSLLWESSGLAEGVYYYKLRIGSESYVDKLVLLRH